MRRIIFAIAGLAACSPSASYTRSSTTTYPSKPVDCRLEVLTVSPQRPFVELGTFDIDSGGWKSPVSSISELVKLVQKRACAEGADAILGRKSDALYDQATLLRWTEAAPASSAAGATEK